MRRPLTKSDSEISQFVNNAPVNHQKPVGANGPGLVIYLGNDRFNRNGLVRGDNLSAIEPLMFFIHPFMHCSKILALTSRRLPDDWEEKYNVRPVLLESFVEKNRFLNVGLSSRKIKVRLKDLFISEALKTLFSIVQTGTIPHGHILHWVQI